jgi:serine/threonine protein phosphatase PrpC
VAETKDQDRVALVPHGDGWVAALCDGTAQSMHSAAAATIATADPVSLWSEHGVSDVVAQLRERRATLIADAAEEEPDPTSFLKRAFAQILRDARQSAFQTTFVTVRVTSPSEHRILVEAKTVGDSAILVFDGEGRLQLSNLPIQDSESGFGHTSPITEVLPDHFRSDDVTLSEELDPDVHIVLCSDGFYDAFATPRELFQWLITHKDDFNSEQGQKLVDALHERLDAGTGDDDLSFIWLCPRTAPESEVAPAAVVKPASPVTWIHCAFQAFRRWLSRIFGRPAPPHHGEQTL